MSGQVEMTNPVETSVGGMRGHLLRRGVHLSMIGIPYLYFAHGERVADAVGVSLPQLVAGVVIVALLLEGLRLKLGLTVFGQRDYEAKQVSALAWGAIGQRGIDDRDVESPLVAGLGDDDEATGVPDDVGEVLSLLGTPIDLELAAGRHLDDVERDRRVVGASGRVADGPWRLPRARHIGEVPLGNG